MESLFLVIGTLFAIFFAYLLLFIGQINGETNVHLYAGPPKWLIEGFIFLTGLLFPKEIFWKGRKPLKGEKVIFVSNHQRLGADLPFLLPVIYSETKFWVRGLTDKFRNFSS